MFTLFLYTKKLVAALSKKKHQNNILTTVKKFAINGIDRRHKNYYIVTFDSNPPL